MTSQENQAMPTDEQVFTLTANRDLSDRFVIVECRDALARKRAADLIIAAPDLLALAKKYARECLECGGTGRDSRYANRTDLPLDFLCCDECSDIWAVINKAEGRADHER